MRAVSILGSQGPESITVRELPVPEVGVDDVRIRVVAAGVNPSDPFMWHAAGRGPLQPPVIPGLDAAGVVDAIGEGVDRLHVGDRVMAVVNARRPEGGAQAEYIVVPAASVVQVSDSIDLISAATLPMTGLTALEGLRMLNLPAGAVLAVTGGAGQLSSYLIPLAVQRGIRVVADASPEDRELVARFGAEHIVPRGTDFSNSVRQLFSDGVDAVYDTANLTRQVLPAIRDDGAIAVIRGWDTEGEPERGITVHAVSVGAAMTDTAGLELLAAQAAAGALQLRIVDTYPPEKAIDAFERMKAGGLRGRLVITF